MAMIKIEVCYALEKEQWLIPLEVPQGSTVIRAIMASGILEKYPDVELSNVGIFSKKVSLNHQVKLGDRIEIYRPLALTPNEARLLRAKRSKVNNG